MKHNIFSSLLLSALLPITLCVANDRASTSTLTNPSYSVEKSTEDFKEYSAELASQFFNPDRYFKECEEPQHQYLTNNLHYSKCLVLVDLIENTSDHAEKKLFQAQLKTDLLLMINATILQSENVEKVLTRTQENLALLESTQLESQKKIEPLGFINQICLAGMQALEEIGFSELTRIAPEDLPSFEDAEAEGIAMQQKRMDYYQEKQDALLFYKNSLIELLYYTK